MSVSSVENVCYDNPFFQAKSDDSTEDSVTIGNKSNEHISTTRNGTVNIKIPYARRCYNQIASEIQIRVGTDNVQKYCPVMKAVYFLACVVVIILMCNVIEKTQSNVSKELKCKMCGNGTPSYFPTEFGKILGDRCDEKDGTQSTYTCTGESACMNIKTTFGSGMKEIMNASKKNRWWAKSQNDTWKAAMIRQKRWLDPMIFEGTIKGCLYGSGHSWVRDECHTFNSSDWGFDSKRYNSTWVFVKTCVCTQDNCNGKT